MSDVVEKTLASIPKFLGGGFLGAGQPSSPKHASVRGFSSFLRQINKARSKHEEEHIVRHEIVEMQQRLALRDTTKQTSDCLCRAIYCELLGYDLSSVYIHAVKLAQQGTGFEKRLGYLACSLLLNENHELILLLINTIQKDLNSSNILDNCAALTVICQLVNSEMIPSVLPLVQEKLKHPRELVRMKAAMCVHKFLLKTPSMVDHFQDQFQRILFDKDPGVMSVGVKIYSVLIQSHDQSHSHKLTENLIGILSQVVSNRLPSEFEFHNVPMPWLQMDILKTLAKLGMGNKQQSELMYPVLKDVIQRLDMKERVAYAILYECIVTITTIYPNEELQREATTCVSRFIGSTNPSLKYIGIKALTALVKSCPESALEHQMTVVELLDDKDQAIQRKTLDLLYCMANPSNVQVVCDRLLRHLSNNTTNTFLQLDLATKVIHLADNFSSSYQWYVDTVFKLLSSCKVTLPRELLNKVVYVIEKGCETDKNGDKSPESKGFQQYLLKKSLGALFQDSVSPQLLLVSVWVLGECGNLLKNMPSEKVITLVLKHFQKQTLDVTTKLWMTSSLTKLVCAKVLDRDVVTRRLAEAREEEKDSVVRQKLTDTLNIAESQINLLLPTMSSSHTKQLDQMDFTLSFLDDYVSQSLTKGAQPYKAKTLRFQPHQPDSDLFCGLNGVTKDNTEGLTKETMSQGSSVSGKLTGGSEGGSDLSGGQRETGLNMVGVKRVWGRKGLISDPQSDTAMARSLSHQRGDNQDIPGTLGGLENEMEDDKAKKLELASALFSGITNKQNSGMENQEGSVRGLSSSLDSRSQGSEEFGSFCSVSPKPLPTNDTGGWRSLHNKATAETPVTENTLSASNDNERKSSHLNSKTEENSVEQNVFTGLCDDADSSVSNLSINVPDLNTDLTASLYAEGKDDLLSDISIMDPPHHWGQALHRDGNFCNIDDRPCLPGSTSAHSLYDVLSPENGNRQFVAMETQNEKQVMDRDTTETLYDEYTDQT
ncbi:AP-4 complex subunit epsilon-1-like isoform X2 [Mizuhopecten yessoensis]|uniref:AP-4 complex subunit epsilon-1-like isoform X2 n=1 Tax=Mizuhopecten yessoensis TaxID=6573 RepID=UPI000B45B841|nr:AP-4 complex subunit epsilon-1-like isoform X2 [Mizuhopecten yessoensis]